MYKPHLDFSTLVLYFTVTHIGMFHMKLKLWFGYGQWLIRKDLQKVVNLALQLFEILTTVAYSAPLYNIPLYRISASYKKKEDAALNP